ncbi:guanitoxin biosynthesis heme-dependent pre-guanitoxin N-hydroxylase GntA [Zunongwangia endophytica]|uniref:Guanitoxin biosynthesis heme-dependent pre-guanitoxin N-hydroxylase GntA n=1 Tax=Zunongwangia endophytica TaxID=1808945 RepID=A0ABV8H4I0_9FLAO|nr:guanitoxin biosynthesis heme-dependent pre-guanitoxin N-hydroxylase GntA [Zunongwangia endophytica]MDN3595544.1 guanitoxin biosynthesis heme-dependent pre-guanitoxin N-hydroxylase GntA [Zunongwangia endophytica]
MNKIDDMLEVAEKEGVDFKENHSEGHIYKDFEEFIIGQDHPCIMAKTVFSMDKVNLNIYKNLGNIEFTKKLYSDLKTYIENYDFESNDFETFIAVFPETVNLNEFEFEEQLWLQLQRINSIDEYDWDTQVSSNPQEENFSFSIAGRSFYVVGLHPNSSRKARRAPFTGIAFNLHWQFEKLREMGTYQRVRDAIRGRDKELQGSINPMLEDFGTHSEARQYSGRKVEKDWECPFKH